MLRLLSFLFLVSAFFSCLPEKTALERALREAGDNRDDSAESVPCVAL